MKDKLVFIIKRYKFFLILISINIILALVYPQIGKPALYKTFDNAIGMLAIIPPMFVVIGMIDVWLPRETMIRIMGEKSGLRGILIAYVLGSFSVGPLYAAFPVSMMLLRKGSRISNVFIFLGAWSTTKVVALTLETAALGIKFTLIRLLINLPVIFTIAFATEKTFNTEEKAALYSRAESEEL